jgi:hypothetical protein
VAELIVNSPVRKDPILRANKEKEGVFNLEHEQALVDQMLN